MNRKYAFLLLTALVGGFAVACGGGMAEEPAAEVDAMANADPNAKMAPMFEVDPTWPNNLPNH
ncbi:uncharacterized protein METZ01_LOCUS464427, partial [marine metagenome]